MLWDERTLYVGFENADQEVRAADDALEILIHDRGSRTSHLRLQLAANGTLSGQPQASGIRAAVTLQGTPGQPQGWTAEVALPLEALAAVAEPRRRPRWGDIWSLNLFRRDATTGKPPVELVWSRLLDHDVHALDQSGDLIFANEEGEHPSAAVERQEKQEQQQEQHQRRRR
jgi:hypothetical protein